jgi:hypothetical protein
MADQLKKTKRTLSLSGEKENVIKHIPSVRLKERGIRTAKRRHQNSATASYRHLACFTLGPKSRNKNKLFQGDALN